MSIPPLAGGSKNLTAHRYAAATCNIPTHPASHMHSKICLSHFYIGTSLCAVLSVYIVLLTVMQSLYYECAARMRVHLKSVLCACAFIPIIIVIITQIIEGWLW